METAAHSASVRQSGAAQAQASEALRLAESPTAQADSEAAKSPLETEASARVFSAILAQAPATHPIAHAEPAADMYPTAKSAPVKLPASTVVRALAAHQKSRPKMAGVSWFPTAAAVQSLAAHRRSPPKSPAFLRRLAANTVHSPAHRRFRPKTEEFL